MVATEDQVRQDDSSARSLRAVLAELSTREARPSVDHRRRLEVPNPLSFAARLIVLLALVKVAGAAITVLIGSSWPAPPTAVPGTFVTVQLVAFSVTGCALLVAHGGDRRTIALGVVFLIVASSFATGYFVQFARIHPAFSTFAPLYPDAFLALYLGRFLEAFPHRRGRFTEKATAMTLQLSGIAGVTFFAANAVVGWRLFESAARSLETLQRQSASNTVYWTVICALAVLLLVLASLGTTHLSKDELRRVRLFWVAFCGGLGPIVLITAAGTIPTVGPAVMQVATRPPLLYLLEALLACLPITMAYAVLVRRVLPARLMLRRAVQHLFARWMLRAALVIPLAVLLAKIYINRHQTIAAFFGADGARLLGLTAVVFVAVFSRDFLLRRIDRWCFRDAPDLRAILVDLTDQTRRATRMDELVAFVTAAIERGFQPETVAVLVRDPNSDQFVSVFGAAEPLAGTSVIAAALSNRDAPIEVDLEDPSSVLRWLPRGERYWLVDSAARLLVPLRASEHHLVGFIAVGDRKSELPYTSDDQRALRAIADAGAFSIESHTFRHASTLSADDWWSVGFSHRTSYAAECPDCGRLYPTNQLQCAWCDAVLQAAQVPEVLFGKFRFEQRIGRGGMGVVYRATDLALERTVAIKTLPGTSPELAQRLRLEARAMAAVTHRNLAIIHGTESWRGRPLLVCEYMSGGTLASRLHRGVLRLDEALTFAINIAEAIAVIHAAGLLHRDIKPSNIGFAPDGLPKLLDFGLVYLLTKATAEGLITQDGGLTDDAALLTLSVGDRLIGTPLYMSPEAVVGKGPTPSFDLWSFNVLLFEAVTGVHPFRGRSVDETFEKIRRGQVPVIESRLPAPVQSYFERALHADLSVRIRSAHETADALRALLARL